MTNIYETLAIYARASRLTRHMNDALEPIGLSFLQAATVIAVDDGYEQPSELGEKLGSSPAAITGILDRLEEAGWVCRNRDLSDRRAIRLSLTDKAVGELTSVLEAFRRGASSFESPEVRA